MDTGDIVDIALVATQAIIIVAFIIVTRKNSPNSWKTTTAALWHARIPLLLALLAYVVAGVGLYLDLDTVTFVFLFLAVGLVLIGTFMAGRSMKRHKVGEDLP